MEKDLKQLTIFTLHAVYRRTDRWLALPAAEKAAVAGEVQGVIDRFADDVMVRGVYSAAGWRPDADVVFWLLSESADRLQDFTVALRHTAFGRATELSWSFPGMTRPPEFVGEHYASFQKGLPPKKYLQLYPFVRTADWYLMPAEERGRILREHGMMGREFPEVQTNNVQAFGLGDYEWILAFETDQFSRFVDLIRRLREAEARKYAQLDIPFILGIRKELPEIVHDLG